MRILIDMDEVLCQWVGRILEWYNEDKGTSWTRDEITSWDVQKNLGPESSDFIRSSMRYPEFYRDLLPVEGALYGMRTLHDLGHDVVIATAVPKCAGSAYAGKLEWLRRNLPWFPLKNFVGIQRKELLAGDVLVDDGLHNIEAFAKTGRSTIVFDAPWNRVLTDDLIAYDPFRAKHWNQILARVEHLSRKETVTPILPKGGRRVSIMTHRGEVRVGAQAKKTVDKKAKRK